MSAIFDFINAHIFLVFQPILMTLVSKFMVCRALSDKTYLLLGLRSPLNEFEFPPHPTVNLRTLNTKMAIITFN